MLRIQRIRIIMYHLNRYGGVVLTHNEVGAQIFNGEHHSESLKCITAADSGEGAILPTWTAVDNNNVKTSRELWEYMKSQGWNVDVRHFMNYILLPSLTWFNVVSPVQFLLKLP